MGGECSAYGGEGKCIRGFVGSPEGKECCVTNRKVAGSIPVGVNGFFIDI